MSRENRKPCVGLILLSAEWFDTVVAMPELVNAVQEDAASIQSWLHPHLNIRSVWRVNSAESLETCCRQLKASELDLVILVFQVWAEDHYLYQLHRAIQDTPLLVWCYQPWQSPPRPATFLQVLRGSGPVGTFEGMGTLRNLGVRYQFTYGAVGEKRLLGDILRIGKSAMVRQQLRRAKFGILPYRNDQMCSTFVDESRLRSELGPSLTYLSVGELQKAAQQVTQPELKKFITRLRQEYQNDGVNMDVMQVAARASLGLASLAQKFSLDLISINDIASELHEVMGLRPCLYPESLRENNILVTLEGDLGAATAAFILNRLTDSPILFCETWFWDEAENLIATGHAGLQDPAVAVPGSVRLTHDYEYAGSDRYTGAHYQFIARDGRVTLLQLRATPTAWQGIVLLGEAVRMASWVEGNPHAAIRLDPPVGEFLRTAARAGSTQHWIMAYGEVLEEVITLFNLLNLPLEVIR